MTRYPWIVPQEHKRNWRAQLGGAGTEDWNMNSRLGRLEVGQQEYGPRGRKQLP